MGSQYLLIKYTERLLEAVERRMATLGSRVVIQNDHFQFLTHRIDRRRTRKQLEKQGTQITAFIPDDQWPDRINDVEGKKTLRR